MTTIAPVIQTETERHATIYTAIADFKTDRAAQLKLHDDRMEDLEKERLAALGWNEKNELTEKMTEHAKFNPRKYLFPFENDESPYFGIVGIHDEDNKIGIKEYVLGKQSLINGSKAHIVDWRKANVSRFFYEYDEGDTYEEEFVNKNETIDRVGKITHKRTITIFQKLLKNIETAQDSYKLVNGKWITKSGDEISVPISAELKTDTGNHELIDIVALISQEQFRSITKDHAGCLYLTGGAGCGKTTIALHRLSYLQFNEPDLFNPEKCLVLVFNRTLKDYVKATSKELLGSTAIDTFTAWGIAAIKNLGCSGLNFVAEMNGFDEIKKHSAIEFLLKLYVDLNKEVNLSPYEDLINFYTNDTFIAHFFADDEGSERMIKFIHHHSKKDNKLAFADVGILLRLLQLRNKSEVIKNAVGYYDHIIADEAQDFAQHELEAIFHALNKRKSMTICADEKQKILSFVDASGLSNFNTELHKIGLDKTTFTVGYRSAPEIMDVANVVAGKQEKRKLKPNDNIVSINKTTSKDTALIAIRKAVKTYYDQDPSCLTAIICKNKAEIADIHKALIHESISSTIHPAGTIVFSPGVIVTNAHQVKGLEFTNVILWNPSRQAYKNNEEDKNLLYVAISRACKRLSIVHYDYLSNWFKL